MISQTLYQSSSDKKQKTGERNHAENEEKKMSATEWTLLTLTTVHSDSRRP